MKAIFERISQIIGDSHQVVNFTITGYKHLSTRLVLHFRDCNQVFDFEEIDGTLVEKSYFTKDQTHEEFLSNLEFFNTIHKKES